MEETELSPLDKLMLAVSASDSHATKIDDKKSTLNELNEDELFLAKIAANDLKVLRNPPKQQRFPKLDDGPSTSKSTSESLSTRETIKKLTISSIHSGDTDSSDDESNRYFENENLNEYGKQITHLLPSEIKNNFSEETISKTWKPKRPTPSKAAAAIPPLKFGLPPVQQTPIKQQKPDENILQDPFFGIRISKPLISSAVLEERMSGRAAVSMFRIKNFLAQNGQTQDWVVAGCIVQKTNARTSQSGNQYVIWTLSDLQNDLQSVSMFLFKSAFKELWKTTVGTVVGVLNPSVLDNREGSKHQATLSVNNHQRVMIFGQSKDYGLCKSRKKDGEPCTAFVNTNRCSYCLYHVKQEYQKCSLRSDCQSIGGGLTALRNKVLGKNEVFYAGKSYMAIPARKNRKLVERDNKRLSDLLNTNNSGLMTSTLPKQQKKKAVASSLEVSRAQRFKDLQLLQKLNGSSDVLAGLESRNNCDLNDISAEVTLEESRKTALDVIAKLKAKSNQNKEPSISLEAKNNQNIEPSISLEAKNNQTSKTPEPNKKAIDTSKFKNLAGTASKISQNPVIDLNTSIINRAKLNSPNRIQKNDPNQNIEPLLSKTPESNKKAIENVIDTSKLKILAGTAPKLSQNPVIDLNTSITNRAKLNSPNRIQKNDPNQNIEPLISKAPESNKKANENVIDASTLKILAGTAPKLSQNPVIDLNDQNTPISNLTNLNSPNRIHKNDPNQNIEPLLSKTPESNKKTTENVIDTSKLRILAGTAPKLSQNPVIDLNTSITNRAKLNSPNQIHKNDPNQNVEPLLSKTPESNKKATENVIDTSKLRILAGTAPKLSQNPVIDLNPPIANRAKLNNLNRIQKNDPNQNTEPLLSKTPEVTKKSIENLLDTSKLKILKDLHNTPAPKLSQNPVIDLNTPITNRAKLKALHWVQKNGPIDKNNPAGGKKSGVKRFLENSENSETKKSKLEEKAQFSERFRKIMELTSAHADLLEKRDLEEEEKYFNKLEQREKMEEKMMSTYKIQCKAVKCLNCKYTSFSAAARCKEEKHPLKVYDTFKRFFKCGNCGNRTVSLEICPLVSCKNCGSSKWERTTMMKEKIAKIGDGLSIRGGEQKFVNSVVSDANVNLLMPDD